MAELVADCPRCHAKEHTFVVFSMHLVKIMGILDGEERRLYEAFCVCKNCNESTIFKVNEKLDLTANERQYFYDSSGPINYPKALNNIIEVRGYVNTRNMASCPAPEDTPEKIKDVFREGAESVTGNCPNAAVAMFRLCVDLATKPLHAEKNLKRRLDGLFESNKLPEDLKELSHCIREDGNAGVHDGTITLDDAKDIMDFCNILLTRLYTEPAKIEAAQKRQQERKSEAKSQKDES